ncbi:hypothetical protein F4804DRAFT_335850 [Jackrogersella minutella]|nr:hypothetical protein F4804DRAFT_335850 [Jackrogersella minutella]
MCLYQNIHAAYHYELLSLDAAERESHACRYERLIPQGELGSTEDGEKCPLHSCCHILGQEVLFWCSNAEDDGSVCGHALAEDVFVPLVIGKREDEEGDSGHEEAVEEVVVEFAAEVAPSRNAAGRKVLPREVPPAMMQFWPEDQPGKIIAIYLEDEVPEVEDQKGTVVTCLAELLLFNYAAARL